jgi:hypothetical protein
MHVYIGPIYIHITYSGKEKTENLISNDSK